MKLTYEKDKKADLILVINVQVSSIIAHQTC